MIANDVKLAEECRDCIINRGAGILQRNNVQSQDLLALITSEVDDVIAGGNSWIGEDLSPAQLGTRRQQIIREAGLGDTYREEKEVGRKIGRALYSQHKGVSLEAALTLSLLANGIEFDVGGEYRKDHETLISEINNGLPNRIIELKIATETIRGLDAGHLLFLLDNVGEHLCDLLLIETLQKMDWLVSVVAKGLPVLNDVTTEDLHDFPAEIPVFSTGSDDVGVFLSRIPEKLSKAIKTADLVISKGMANFETLSREKLPAPILYLFKAKCLPVARVAEVNEGEYVCRLIPAYHNWSG